MTPTQYRTCLSTLSLNHHTAAEVLGCSWRQSHRWAKGETPVPRPVAIVLLTCIGHDIFPEVLAADADATLKALRQVKAA